MINNMQHALQKTHSKIVHIGRWGIAFTTLVFCGAALAADPSGTLSIQVRGFTHERGHAIANLFREGDDVLKPDKAYQRVQAEIHDGKATINFPDLAYGKYAVSVFHDENGNGTLDHNVLRFPAEPLGFSNQFRLSLFSGMPSFEKLKFSFSMDKVVEEVTVK